MCGERECTKTFAMGFATIIIVALILFGSYCLHLWHEIEVMKMGYQQGATSSGIMWVKIQGEK